MSDEWMTRWLPQLRAAAGDRAVLELGCDTGRDTQWLVRHGFDVTATDISVDALAECARVAAPARCVHHDLRDPLPFADASFGAVVASLCLHYFDWPATERAVAEIHRCLAPGGLLLCRVNSVRDHLHGAGQGEEIEPRFYRQGARYAECKRFFDPGDLDRLFGTPCWRELHREEVAVDRYILPKIAWEIVLAAAG